MKKRTPMLLLAAALLFPSSLHAEATAAVTQSSNGNQSPVIHAGHDVNVNYGLNKEEFQQMLQEALARINKEKQAPGLADKERRLLEQKAKALEEKLSDVQKSWQEEQKLRKETEEKLIRLNGLVPDEQLKKAQERLAQGDKEAAEKAFDAVDDKESEAVALAAHQSGKLAEDRVDYEKAMRKYKKAVLLQKENPDYLLDAGKMARTMGDYPQAQEWLEKLLKMREAEGKEDVELATALNNLAVLHYFQGRYEEAEPLYKRALEIREQKLGKDHPKVAQVLNNLALLYDNQSRYDAAEPLYKLALEIKEQKLGKGHPDVAATLNNLAGLYESQGRYEAAEPLYKRALEIKEQKLGKDHTLLAITLSSMAVLYKAQGKYKEAEPLYQRALAIFKAKLPAGHPYIKNCQAHYDDLKAKLAAPPAK